MKLGRCSLPSIVWSLAAWILALHLYTSVYHPTPRSLLSESHISSRRLPMYSELEEFEEKATQIKSPRGKRRGNPSYRPHRGRNISAAEDFISVSSVKRPLYFPDRVLAVNPLQCPRFDKYHYYPGREWLDTDGKPIQAHGGGILYVHKTNTFYWYGENKDGRTYRLQKRSLARVTLQHMLNMWEVHVLHSCSRYAYLRLKTSRYGTIVPYRTDLGAVDVVGVSCYSSKDLWTWKNEGVVLAAEKVNKSHDLYVSNVVERPKVIYNDKTQQYVMWMHIDNANYSKASVGLAISSSPVGPFTYLYSGRPHGFESRDMTLFKDDDGEAYLVYSSEDNSELHVGVLTDDYLNLKRTMRRIMVGMHREAPAVFKHRGMYYLITSGCTGWAPNAARAHSAESMLGPWVTLGNPCVGGNEDFRQTTFFAQGTFVLSLPDLPDLFLFMADRWNLHALRDSRYVWLPLTMDGPVDEPLDDDFEFPLWLRVSIHWHQRWRLPLGWNSSGVTSKQA